MTESEFTFEADPADILQSISLHGLLTPFFDQTGDQMPASDYFDPWSLEP